MGAYSSASPSSWRPTARTLGALFAGSAVTLSVTVLHGGSLLMTGSETGSIADPPAGPAHPTVAQPAQLPPTSSTASVSGPGQAAPWTPGAAPRWGSTLRDLPVRRAPVQEAPRLSAPASAASAGPVGAGTGPTAPRRSVSGANTGSGAAAPQTADPQQGGSFDGLLSTVFHVTNGIAR